jgi:hypothetical protein
LNAELRRKGGAILIDRSRAVKLANNEVTDPRPGIAAAVEILPGATQGESGVRIEDLKADLAPGARPVMDLRGPRPSGKDRK